jgi:hypothetical protein
VRSGVSCYGVARLEALRRGERRRDPALAAAFVPSRAREAAPMAVESDRRGPTTCQAKGPRRLVQRKDEFRRQTGEGRARADRLRAPGAAGGDDGALVMGKARARST